jgi:hypothetical protein
MFDPVATFCLPRRVARVCGRLLEAFDTASVEIAGLALLTGARAFSFIALVAWREPVLGGAGLLVLALAGWVCLLGEDLRRASTSWRRAMPRSISCLDDAPLVASCRVPKLARAMSNRAIVLPNAASPLAAADGHPVAKSSHVPDCKLKETTC